eukprot:COSAG02_NODE_150_length_33596_cov_61.953966_16_plen_65_part_00
MTTTALLELAELVAAVGTAAEESSRFLSEFSGPQTDPGVPAAWPRSCASRCPAGIRIATYACGR